MAYPLDSLTDNYTPLEGQPIALPILQNYQPRQSFEQSHAEVILNRLKPQAEEIIAEEQAGLRAGRSTTEQLFNLRILCDKYLQHQQNL